jgi:hypothetical protein
MSTITLPTTLHCAGCVESIKPFFDSSDKIKEWKVDLKPPVKTLTASGEELKQEDVVALLHQAGYDVLKTAPVSTELPPIGEVKAVAAKESFWADQNKWKRASFNTLNCLIGCSIGDFGMIIYLQAFYPQTSMALQMALAVIAGLCTSILLESVILKARENFNWRLAFTTAFSMSFISMVTMEVAMNISDFMVTGGKAAFDNPIYWFAFAIAMVAGFLAPLPYNYYKLKKFNQACH